MKSLTLGTLGLLALSFTIGATPSQALTLDKQATLQESDKHAASPAPTPTPHGDEGKCGEGKCGSGK